MTPEEEIIANDFEQGWDNERLDQARTSWGPGLYELLPHVLAEKVSAQAAKEHTSELEIINKALTTYLLNNAA